MRSWVVMAVLVTGCGPTEENWGDKFADAQCSFARRCDAANFWYTWDDVETCETAASDLYASADLSGCTFDDEAARQCLQALNQDCKEVGREYDGLVAPCLLVWACGADSADTGSGSGTGTGTGTVTE